MTAPEVELSAAVDRALDPYWQARMCDALDRLKAAERDGHAAMEDILALGRWADARWHDDVPEPVPR